MVGELKFTRDYAQYGDDVRDFEKASDVGAVLAETLRRYSYPYNVYIGQKFTSIWLREGEPKSKDPEDLDLIFVAGGQGFLEIVLRDQGFDAVYGGWLVDGESVEVTNEIVNGYRVINVTMQSGETERHEFIFGEG